MRVLSIHIELRRSWRFSISNSVSTSFPHPYTSHGEYWMLDPVRAFISDY